MLQDIGIPADVLANIPVSCCIYYLCNIWDQQTMGHKLEEGIDWISEVSIFFREWQTDEL